MGFRLLRYIMLKRKLIFSITLVFFIVSLLYVLIADREYESKALLMPPLEESGEGLIAARIAQLNLPSMIIPVTAGATSAAVLADILESRRLREMIIGELGLKERYKADTMDDALRELEGRTRISVTSSGLIRLSVKDESPEMASEIARMNISGLDSLNRFLQFTRAEHTMEFISGQIGRYRNQLNMVRDEIARFQQEHGVIDFTEQVKGAIDVAANLKVKAVLAEIERDLLREFAKRDALELKRKEAEYRNLITQLNRIMQGDTSEAVFFPLEKLPELYQRYAALKRDLDVNERVYSFLLERYEEAGIDRARNTPTVHVVDEPNLPEKPAGFPRWLVVLLVTIIGMVWSTAVVAWWGWIGERERSAEEDKAFTELVEIVEQDLARLRKFLRL